MNQTVRRVTMADVQRAKKASGGGRGGVGGVEGERRRKLVGYLRNALAVGVLCVLVGGWTNNVRTMYRERLVRGGREEERGREEEGDDDDDEEEDGGRGVAPPPQTLVEKLPRFEQSRVLANKGVCLICMGQRVNPTAATSGFVFCYRCILLHVRAEGKCPVSGVKCKEEEITRLFEE